ncbi:MAG TPA: tryptophan-rich sensory protein [Phycisphaerae bacterium]|nr:tryptophan-rich sensory protein [Phycisphaerae bacterium]
MSPAPCVTGLSRRRRILGLAFWVALCLLVMVIGSLWTRSSVGAWYQGLSRPWWTPPGWVFGVVWPVLYTMMAVSAWLVWRCQGGPIVPTGPLALFAAQLALNLFWSAVFFAMERPGAAFAEICVLWLAVMATTAAFARVKRAAGWLMVPYACWTTFAAMLNLAIWRMNA